MRYWQQKRSSLLAGKGVLQFKDESSDVVSSPAAQENPEEGYT
jgi:hypothetical protein